MIFERIFRAAPRTGPDSVACEGDVMYTGHDGRQALVPFANVFERHGTLISVYRIYIDNSPLMQP